MADDNTEGLVIRFGYDLSSGMDQGIQDYYKAMNRLQRVAKNQKVKVTVDWGDSQRQFDQINALIVQTITLIRENSRALAQVDGNYNALSASAKQVFDQNSILIEKNIKEINEFSEKMETLPKVLGTSVSAMKAQLANLSNQWNDMAVGEKFSGKGFSKMTAEAKALLKAYVALQKEMEKHGMGIDAVARKQQEAAILRKKNLKTEAEYLEQIRILEERISTTKIGTSKYNKYKKQLDDVIRKLEIIQGKQKTANTSLELTEIKMKRLNDSFRLADHYTGRLLVRLAAYAGVAMFARMLRSIKDITAEFELQEVALGAILQDVDKANTLFEQIKKQAVRSPFEVKELVTYTKQLAAYRVESERLFDVTMQLADISSALGVDMQRLILAYGQVKAASVLRGQELRQFTEAGIPLVQKLADKFTELRGRVVSTGEVFELISRRAVSFGMIEEIFNDMTAAGGEFYKMQEKQAETLKGRWTNLKDAISIAYDEIGRSKVVNAFLNGIIKTTAALAKNWRGFSTVILATVSSIITLTMAMKQSKVAMSALTNEEIKQAIADKKLQLQQVQHAAALKALNKAEIKRTALIRLSNIHTIRALKSVTLMTKWMHKLRAGILSLEAAIGPAGWVILGISLIASAIAIFKKRTESLQETLENAKVRAAEYINEMQRLPRDQKILDQYDALASKMDKTADETKKLTDLQKRLAAIYPEHARLVNSEATAYDIDTAAIRANSEAKLENMRISITDDITELDKRKKAIQAEMGKFVKKKWKDEDGNIIEGWGREGVAFQNLKKATEEYKKLNKELLEVDDAIDEAKKALDFVLIKSGMKDFDQAWKRQIRYMSNMTGELTGFADDTIEGFNTIEEAWAKAAEEYKNYDEAIIQLEDSLKSKQLNDDERKEIEDSLALLSKQRSTMRYILEYYNQLALIQDKTRGKGGKTDTSMFKDELDLVKRIYKKYVDLRKVQSEDEARQAVSATYGDLTAIDFLSPEALAKRIADIRSRAIEFASRSADEDVKKAIEDFVSVADEEIDNVSYTELENAIKERLQNLAKEITTANEASKFYDEVFGKTFNRGLAEALTSSIYGADRTSAVKALKDYVREVFGDVGMSAFDQTAGSFNWTLLEGLITEDMPKEVQKLAYEIVENGRKTSQEQYRQWMTDLAKEKDVLDKRIDLHHQTIQRIREIEATADLLPSQRNKLVTEYRKREARLASDIAYQAFKESPVYTQLFANLDTASSAMLNRLKSDVLSLQEQWKDTLDPANLKELQSRIEELDKQLVQRNPFKTIVKSLREYHNAETKSDRKNADKKAVKSAQITNQLREKAIADAVRLEDAEQRLKDIEDGRKTASDEEIESLKTQINALRVLALSSQELADEAKKRSDADAQDADHWRALKLQIVSAAEILNSYASQLTTINDMIFRMTEYFSKADKVQREFLNNMKKSVDDIINGMATLGKGIAEIYGGNYGQGIIDALVGLELAVEGVIGTERARVIREQNTLIEEQQDKLDNLTRYYNKLKEAEDKAFGSEYLTNRKHEIEVLEAEAEAYRKQAEAERSKPDKDRDIDAAEAYEQRAMDIMDDISKKAIEVQQRFLGTDLTSAARDFASAWLDAYASYGNTLDAMGDKFKEMVKKMVKESAMVKVAEVLLKPIFTEIDKLGEKERVTEQDLQNTLATIATLWEQIGPNLDAALTGTAHIFEKLGVSLRDSASGMSGISKDIAQASESSILGLAAGINTQNYYISSIYGSVNTIVALLQGSNNASPQQASRRAQAYSVDYTSHMNTIMGHTEAMNNNIASMLSLLQKVIVVSGGKPYMRTRMN